ARLILLGDKDQLASVEAGAVLGDICNSGAAHRYSVGLIDEVAALSGDRLPRRDDAPRATGLWDCIVHLSRSYRYGAASAIGALARAVNAGDSAAALEILTSDADRDVRLLAPDTPGQLNSTIRETVVPGYLPYLQATQPEERRRDFDRFRVLCAHRRGPGGVEALNQAIEAALSEAGLLRIEGPTYAGRPIIITRNDYQLGLFNGDVGLLVDDPEGVGRTLACFPAPDGTQRLLSPSRLPPHDTVFAMSIHKSQGSEFDAVAVLLPERVSSVLSRELLYTAITRARRTVTVHATREMVAQAI